MEILAAAVNGLGLFLNLELILFMMLGICIGMILGLIPGLGGLIGLGLLLPFSYTMDATTAMAFLLGMFAVVTQTDTIPAILIGVPGTAAAQATVLDGNAMTKRGEAGRALSASYFASIWGASISVLIFTLSLPVLRSVVKLFAAPEYFLVSLLGLLMAGILSSASRIRGLSAAFIGLMITTVGIPERSDFSRYDFGFEYLFDGLKLVPVVLGLFAIPEVLELLIRRSTIVRDNSEEVAVETKAIRKGFMDTIKNFGLIVRCSIIGTTCGVIPGMGAGAAEWFAYGQAKMRDKDNTLGTGNVQGIVAPESSTAAMKPGGLLTTIALGIPGNPAMAIMMVAFIVLGIRPGSEMITDKLDVTYMFMWTLVIGNIVAALVCLLLQKQMVKICYLNPKILVPVVICFMTTGALLTTGDYGDIWVFLGAGVLGYFFKRYDWSRISLIIGMALGKIIEIYLFIAMDRYHLSFLWTRPISIIFEVLIVLILASGLVKLYKSKRKSELLKKESKGDFSYSNKAISSPVWWIGIVIGIISAMALYVAWDWEPDRGTFPVFVSAAILVLVTLHTIQGALFGISAVPDRSEDGIADAGRRKLLFIGYIALLVGLIAIIGVSYAMPVFLLLVMTYEKVSLKISIPLAVFFFLFIEYLLKTVLHINFYL